MHHKTLEEGDRVLPKVSTKVIIHFHVQLAPTTSYQFKQLQSAQNIYAYHVLNGLLDILLSKHSIKTSKTIFCNDYE